MPEKAVLCFGDQQIELPVLVGTEGEKAVDISRLRDATGLTTYDPSLSNTAVCKSAVTFIDGDKGILRYRGIPIEQFTDHPNFIEAAWLLIFGRLPKKDELDRFSQRLTLQRTAARGHEAPVPAHSGRRPADGLALGDAEQHGLLSPAIPRAGRRGVVRGNGRPIDQQSADDCRLLVSAFAGIAVHLSRIPTCATVQTSCT